MKNPIDMSPLERLFYWITEREEIRVNKEDGVDFPWTEDSILMNYRFCNVRREDDKVTKWISANWRQPHAKDPDLFFAMAVSRYINYPPTLKEIGYPIPWNPKQILSKLRSLVHQKKQVFNGAYIISTNGIASDKQAYVVENVLDLLYQRRDELRPTKKDTLKSFNDRLLKCNGIAGFMSGQIIADVKYVKPLRDASDWNTFAVSGPGSRRGMNRLKERAVDASWVESAWYKHLLDLQATIKKGLKIELHAQDVQNCLCEYDKYVRMLTGEGRPKQRYHIRPS